MEPMDRSKWASRESFSTSTPIGKQGDVFPDGSGRLIKAGTKINFQMHLHSTGKEDTATNVTLGLKFYPPWVRPAACDLVDHGECAPRSTSGLTPTTSGRMAISR